jgi:hypothetical protein
VPLEPADSVPDAAGAPADPPPVAATAVPEQSGGINAPRPDSSTASGDPPTAAGARSWLTEEDVRHYTGSRSIARESQTPMGQHVLTELFGTAPASGQ